MSLMSTDTNILNKILENQIPNKILENQINNTLKGLYYFYVCVILYLILMNFSNVKYIILKWW